MDPPGRRHGQEEEPEQLGENEPNQYGGHYDASAHVRANDQEEEEEAPALEQEEEEEDDDRFMPVDILPPKDPRRMRLTREEREWGRAVKEAIEADPELDDLSDFMYAQIALVEQGNVEKALERAHVLQGFRQEYDVLDTLQDAQWRLERWIYRVPGHVMHHFFSEQHGGYVLILDANRLDTTCTQTEEGIKDLMAGTYYVHHALCVDMDAIRQGATFFAECSGFRWKAPNMVDLKIAQLACSDSLSSYPFDLQQIQCYNTGVMMNTLLSLMRQWLPPHMKKKISLGHRSEGSLRDICMMPSVKVATLRVTLQMKQALQERYNNIGNFKL